MGNLFRIIRCVVRFAVHPLSFIFYDTSLAVFRLQQRPDETFSRQTCQPICHVVQIALSR